MKIILSVVCLLFVFGSCVGQDSVNVSLKIGGWIPGWREIPDNYFSDAKHITVLVNYQDSTETFYKDSVPKFTHQDTLNGYAIIVHVDSSNGGFTIWSDDIMLPLPDSSPRDTIDWDTAQKYPVCGNNANRIIWVKKVNGVIVKFKRWHQDWIYTKPDTVHHVFGEDCIRTFPCKNCGLPKIKPDTIKWKPYYPKLSKKKAHHVYGNKADTLNLAKLIAGKGVDLYLNPDSSITIMSGGSGAVTYVYTIAGDIKIDLTYFIQPPYPSNNPTQILYGVYITNDFKIIP
jgi:hypothetical protein